MGNNLSPSNLDSYASNLFNVYNVDARLFKHAKGKIQITNSSLLLTYENNHGQQGPILWPLNGIRRYGFHKDIFLFECGRKCASGEGLFAFKCRKAKRLNDAIHKAVVNNPTQICNLKDNLSLSKKSTRVNNVDDLNSTLVTNVFSNHDVDSFNYTSLNDSNQNTSNNTNILGSIAVDTEYTPYYVNHSLVRLPLNLALMDNVTGTKEYNEYVNNIQVDPSILHIANKFNSQNKNKKMTTKMNVADSSCSNYVMTQYKSQLRTPNTIQEENLLNYVNPVILKRTASEMNSDSDEIKNDSKLRSDYVSIDMNKTPAAQFSKNQLENKHMEYLMLSKLKR